MRIANHQFVCCRLLRITCRAKPSPAPIRRAGAKVFTESTAVTRILFILFIPFILSKSSSNPRRMVVRLGEWDRRTERI